MMTWRVAWAVSGISVLAASILGSPALATGTSEPTMQRERIDACDVGRGGNDIHSVNASYNKNNGTVVVLLRMCADVEADATYRVFLDHKRPFVTDRRRGSSESQSGGCIHTADTVLTHGPDGDTGPGEIVAEGNNLRYTVKLAKLGVSPEAGETKMLIWATSRAGKVVDHAPDTEQGDRCGQPQAATETLTLALVEGVLAFVTSGEWGGALGSQGTGLVGADATCQQQAYNAGLPFVFQAWLANEFGSPSTRFNQAAGPFYRTDGALVANNYADLTTCTKGSSGTDCLSDRLNHDEYGTNLSDDRLAVWTNVEENGTSAGTACDNWTSASEFDKGNIGLLDKLGEGWTNADGLFCVDDARLYCFAQ